MLLEMFKVLFAGAILISSMFLGSKCWHYFVKADNSVKNGFKFIGWTMVYIIALAILNNL